jgi:nucleotide-binding universal stress UspA family protein
MLRSIVVPLDGSPLCEHALPAALALARRCGAELRLVQVHTPLTPAYGDGLSGLESTFDPETRRSEQANLERTVERVRTLTKVKVSSVLLDGAVVPELLSAAQGADLVVMTTHGRGPLARFWLGSVADELVRQIPIPVLLLRPPEGQADLTSDVSWRRVLVPLDGSPLAEQILEPAIALGTLLKAEYSLLRVIAPMVRGLSVTTDEVVGRVDETMLAQLRSFHEADRVAAHEYLDRVAKALRAQSLTVQTRVIVHELPAVAILDEARASRADIVALATHGRRGIRRLVLGSVADKVLRASPVPVLLHGPKGMQNES